MLIRSTRLYGNSYRKGNSKIQQPGSMEAAARATDRILAAAVQLYGIRDPELITVEEVARQAGLSKGLIVFHFGGLEGLRSVVREYLGFRFQQIWLQDNSASVMKRLTAWASLLEEEPGLFRLYINLAYREQEVAEIVQFRMRMAVKITELFRSTQAETPDLNANIFCAWWEGSSLRSLVTENPGASVLAEGKRILDLLG